MASEESSVDRARAALALIKSATAAFNAVAPSEPSGPPSLRGGGAAGADGPSDDSVVSASSMAVPRQESSTTIDEVDAKALWHKAKDHALLPDSVKVWGSQLTLEEKIERIQAQGTTHSSTHPEPRPQYDAHTDTPCSPHCAPTVPVPLSMQHPDSAPDLEFKIARIEVGGGPRHGYRAPAATAHRRRRTAA
jgi:hypothetical protein